MPNQEERLSLPDFIREEAARQHVDPALALAIAEQESNFRYNAVGPPIPGPDGQPTHAIGTFQLLPSTAAMLGVDPNDPIANVQGGIKYLRQLLERYPNDAAQALRDYGGVKSAPSTYVNDVLTKMERYQAGQPGGGVSGVPAGSAVGTPPPRTWLSTARDLATATPLPEDAGSAAHFTEEAIRGLHPVNVVKGLGTLLTTNPVTTAKAMYGAQRSVYDEGAAMRAAGDQGGGLLRQAEALVPLFGPRLAEADKLARAGEYARAAGAAADVAGQLFGPALLKGRKVIPGLIAQRLTPEARAAVELGQQAGVNVPADVATGSPFLLKLRRAVEATPTGSSYAERAALERGVQMPALAEQLAGRVHPTPVVPETAGAGLTQGVEGYINARDAAADLSYNDFRAREAAAPPQRVQTGTQQTFFPPGQAPTPLFKQIRLPVDIRGFKAALRPVYDELTRLIPAAQRDASPGLGAIASLLAEDDFLPASIAERNLSALKRIGRGADLPELRNLAQGLGAKAASELQAAVDAGVSADPAALAALKQGRLQTAAKHGAEEIFDKLREEPVQAFRQATLPKDTGIDYLRQLQALAPQEIPKLARALLEDLFTTARKEGGWQRATGIEARWAQLGRNTKQILFGPAADDLDRFFLLGKLLEQNPNPSGTALTLTGVGSLVAAIRSPSTGIPSLIASGQLAKLMNSPAGVRFLTKGLTLTAGTAAAATWTAAFLTKLHKAGAAVGVPPAPPPTGRP